MDDSDILYFFCSGRGKGESEGQGVGGHWLFIENSRRGGGSRRGRWPRGWEGGIGEFCGGGG